MKKQLLTLGLIASVVMSTIACSNSDSNQKSDATNKGENATTEENSGNQEANTSTETDSENTNENTTTETDAEDKEETKKTSEMWLDELGYEKDCWSKIELSENDLDFSQVIDMDKSYYIMKDGSVGEWSWHQLYQGDVHHKKYDNIEKKITGSSLGGFNTTDNTLYAWRDDGFKEISDWKLYIGGNEVDDSEIFKYTYMYHESARLVSVENNKLCLWNSYYDYDSLTFYISDIDEEYEIPDGAVIEMIYRKAIKTDKGYYHIKCTNAEEANKYVDVEREYGLVKDEFLSEHMDDILFYNGMCIVFKDEPRVIYYNTFDVV